MLTRPVTTTRTDQLLMSSSLLFSPSPSPPPPGFPASRGPDRRPGPLWDSHFVWRSARQSPPTPLRLPPPTAGRPPLGPGQRHKVGPLPTRTVPSEKRPGGSILQTGGGRLKWQQTHRRIVCPGVHQSRRSSARLLRDRSRPSERGPLRIYIHTLYTGPAEQATHEMRRSVVSPVGRDVILRLRAGESEWRTAAEPGGSAESVLAEGRRSAASPAELLVALQHLRADGGAGGAERPEEVGEAQLPGHHLPQADRDTTPVTRTVTCTICRGDLGKTPPIFVNVGERYPAPVVTYSDLDLIRDVICR